MVATPGRSERWTSLHFFGRMRRLAAIWNAVLLGVSTVWAGFCAYFAQLTNYFAGFFEMWIKQAACTTRQATNHEEIACPVCSFLLQTS